MTSDPLQELFTVRDWIRWAASQFSRADLFFGHGTDNARDEAAVLLLWLLQHPWESLSEIYDARITTDEKQHFTALVRERIESRCPVAYITGEAWFGGMRFHVTPDVLVPRSPMAELILNGLQPWLREEPAFILDLCTGSGCLGILSAQVFPSAQIDLSDLSLEALKVAQRNVEEYQLDARCRVICSDVFMAQEMENQRYDLIISNPPYVDTEDLAAMPAEYHAEPVLGLQAGEDGLGVVRRILAEAREHLNPGGLLLVEVGNSWQALEHAYPKLDFIWPELENGGHGVFLLTSEQLKNL